jgi:mannosyltransferase OCH1-like enzyme
MYQHINVPKVIYFVWAGGIAPLPPIGAEIISSWAKSCPNCEIHLLVDETTAGKLLEQLVEDYKVIFKTHQVDILLKNDEVRIHSGNAPIILKDIKREGLRNELVAYEIEQLIPNYGAASDLIRYEVLSRGGCYFDGTDVKPHPDYPLEKEVFSNLTKHTLYVDYLTQNPRPNSLELAKFNFDTIGNDFYYNTK